MPIELSELNPELKYMAYEVQNINEKTLNIYIRT